MCADGCRKGRGVAEKARQILPSAENCHEKALLGCREAPDVALAMVELLRPSYSLATTLCIWSSWREATARVAGAERQHGREALGHQTLIHPRLKAW